MASIYVDYNATTPTAPEVVDAMLPYLTEHFGNPSSGHGYGSRARAAVGNARDQVAQLLDCLPEEVVFTSGGTESNNHAIIGAYLANRDRGNHVITTQVEHPATIQPCRFLETLGASVTYLPVDAAGMVDPDDVRRAVASQTILVSVMHANNEVGTIQPVAEISQTTRERGILFHTDAAQSVGKIPARAPDLGVDLLSVAGHKLYAPKGIGALYVRGGATVERILYGANQEAGRRAGTESVPLIVALGAACELARRWVGMPEVQELRDSLWSGLRETFGDRVVLNGHPTRRLPNTLNVSFVGEVGSKVLSRVPGIAASTGSACHEGVTELSPVLKAMGVPEDVGAGAVRFSLGRATTARDVRDVVQLLRTARL